MSDRLGKTYPADGLSRPFEPDSQLHRMVIAIVLATRDGWAEIRPPHWAEAGAIVKALRTRGLLAKAPSRPASREVAGC